jgi:hypothetical protein
MKRLTIEQKRFLVRCLASKMTPQAAAESLADHYGVEITRQNAENYDPTKALGHNLSEDLKKLFWEVRMAFWANVDAVPIAHKGARLLELQEDLDALAEKKASVPPKAGGMLATITKERREILKQAAQEVGGIFEREKPEGDGQPTEAILQHFQNQVAKAWGDGGESE